MNESSFYENEFGLLPEDYEPIDEPINELTYKPIALTVNKNIALLRYNTPQNLLNTFVTQYQQNKETLGSYINTFNGNTLSLLRVGFFRFVYKDKHLRISLLDCIDKKIQSTLYYSISYIYPETFKYIWTSTDPKDSSQKQLFLSILNKLFYEIKLKYQNAEPFDQIVIVDINENRNMNDNYIMKFHKDIEQQQMYDVPFFTITYIKEIDESGNVRDDEPTKSASIIQNASMEELRKKKHEELSQARLSGVKRPAQDIELPILPCLTFQVNHGSTIGLSNDLFYHSTPEGRFTEYSTYEASILRPRDTIRKNSTAHFDETKICVQKSSKQMEKDIYRLSGFPLDDSFQYDQEGNTVSNESSSQTQPEPLPKRAFLRTWYMGPITDIYKFTPNIDYDKLSESSNLPNVIKFFTVILAKAERKINNSNLTPSEKEKALDKVKEDTIKINRLEGQKENTEEESARIIKGFIRNMKNRYKDIIVDFDDYPLIDVDLSQGQEQGQSQSSNEYETLFRDTDKMKNIFNDNSSNNQPYILESSVLGEEFQMLIENYNVTGGAAIGLKVPKKEEQLFGEPTLLPTDPTLLKKKMDLTDQKSVGLDTRTYDVTQFINLLQDPNRGFVVFNGMIPKVEEVPKGGRKTKRRGRPKTKKRNMARKQTKKKKIKIKKRRTL
jgi:hypothetical protein